MAFTKKTASKAGKKSSRKGKPNKVNQELRERIKLLLEENFEQFEKDLKSLQPKERVQATLKLFEFTVPKLQRIDQINMVKNGNGISAAEVLASVLVGEESLKH